MKFLLIAFLVVAAGCVSSQAYVEAGGSRIYVDIADSPDEWSGGLMYVEEMPQDRGMLFVFPDEADRSFWMRNTLIPLDMIFADADGVITNITRSAQPCKAILCESYYGRARYVLEVNGGFSDAHGINIGDSIEIHD